MNKRGTKNRAQIWFESLEIAIKKVNDPVVKMDLIDLKDKLASGRLQWVGGGKCQPNEPGNTHE